MAELIEERALVRPVSRKLRLDLVAQRMVLVAVFVGVWWLASLSVPHYILPGPARVWEALQLIARNGDLWSNLGITFWRVTIGLCLRLWWDCRLVSCLEQTNAPAISSNR